MTSSTFSLDKSFAEALDGKDVLSAYRERFFLPTVNKKTAIYLVGNSLGAQPKAVKPYVEQELEDWAQLGVEGHFHGQTPWMPYHEVLADPMSKIVGALPAEVVMMNSLTVNLHLMMASFFKPQGRRRKILIEADAFPSDLYAAQSQLKWHGLNPQEDLLLLRPRKNEHTLRTEDILNVIETWGADIAMSMLGGVNYYTGQWFDMRTITAAAKEQGIKVGWDLAHAVGNVPLQLHEWGVDFAAWCNYKYLNGGPGGVAGAFVHEKHHKDTSLSRLAGWWGHDKETRFEMGPDFQPIHSAEGWQLSNAPVLSMAAFRASLDIYEEVGMTKLREKSLRLSGYLRQLLETRENLPNFTIITPASDADKGCQLSLLTDEKGKGLFDYLTTKGVMCDWREPNVIRIAPVPLYNTFVEAWEFVELLATYQRENG